MKYIVLVHHIPSGEGWKSEPVELGEPEDFFDTLPSKIINGFSIYNGEVYTFLPSQVLFQSAITLIPENKDINTLSSSGFQLIIE